LKGRDRGGPWGRPTKPPLLGTLGGAGADAPGGNSGGTWKRVFLALCPPGCGRGGWSLVAAPKGDFRTGTPRPLLRTEFLAHLRAAGGEQNGGGEGPQKARVFPLRCLHQRENGAPTGPGAPLSGPSFLGRWSLRFNEPRGASSGPGMSRRGRAQNGSGAPTGATGPGFRWHSLTTPNGKTLGRGFGRQP